MEIRKYKEYETNTKCSVHGCNNRAEYEVYLYDFYKSMSFEFMEQDYTCPFICGHHMEVNEAEAIGKREARRVVRYPYSNKGNAQGYTKYLPLKTVYPAIYEAHTILVSTDIALEFVDVNDKLIKYLAKYPHLLREIDPRKFEEIVAELFAEKGFEVNLTQATRDGGKDIFAIQKSSFGSVLYVVECKRYQSTNKVGVEVVRGLYGVKQAERANVGVIVTTSSFTKDAIDFATPLRYELSLLDFEALKTSLQQYGR